MLWNRKDWKLLLYSIKSRSRSFSFGRNWNLCKCHLQKETFLFCKQLFDAIIKLYSPGNTYKMHLCHQEKTHNFHDGKMTAFSFLGSEQLLTKKKNYFSFRKEWHFMVKSPLCAYYLQKCVGSGQLKRTQSCHEHTVQWKL